MDKVLYFFDQPHPRSGKGRRKRKVMDESYCFTSSVSTYFQAGEGRSSDLESGESLLPDLKTAVSFLKQRLDGLFGDHEDLQRLIFEEARLTAPDLLARLEMYMNLFVDVKPSIPTSLRNDLSNCSWSELIANVRYEVREWQCLRTRETEINGRKITRNEVPAISTRIELSSRAVNKSSGVSCDAEVHSSLGKDLLSVQSTRRSASSHPSSFVAAAETVEKRDDASSPGHKLITKPKSHMQLSVCSSRSDSVEPGLKPEARLPLKHPGPQPDSKSMSHQAGYWTQIQFQLSSKACRDKGWITDSGQTESEITVENILRQLTSRLRAAIREDKLQSDQGREFDYNILLFHFYGDNLRESVSKTKWSGSVTAQGLQMLKGLKPRIPPLTMAIGTGKKIFKVSMLDGSSIVYYPSGQVAVSYTRPGQIALPGFYTVVYDDEPGLRMLASFTPSGKGCCYHSDGSLWFLATESGYILAEQGSLVMEKFDWPTAGNKLSTPINLQLNQKLVFRCSGRQNFQIQFSWQRQTIRFYVGSSAGAEKSPTKEELGCLQSGLDFVSKTAHSFSEPQFHLLMKQKHKLKMSARKDILPEIESSTIALEKTSASKENENSRLKLERRIKSIVEEWMLHYQSSLGILPAEETSPDESLIDIHVHSARSSSVESEVMTDGNDSILLKTLHFVRLLSAPVGEVCRSSRQQQTPDHLFQSLKLNKNSTEKIELGSRRLGFKSYSSPSSAFVTSIHSPETGVRLRSFITHPVSPEAWDPALGLCPAKVNLMMLGEFDTDKHCPHRTIPFITDLEYDDFIERFIPENQLAVVAVISSLNPLPTSNCRFMLESIHERRFHTRLWPCFQSRNDDFRIFLYDIATAAEYSGNTKPLLMRRHNVDAGMFLMYKNGQLRFCDHIFNGYGTEEKDFLKQLQITNSLADDGHFLPSNFRFCPQLRPVFSQSVPVEHRRKTMERKINLTAHAYQNRDVLNQVVDFISYSDSVNFREIRPKKTKSERNNSASINKVLASQYT